jgi:hypothetical protein
MMDITVAEKVLIVGGVLNPAYGCCWAVPSRLFARKARLLHRST